MTEYDFSPEAYTRHFETQARIARWTESTHLVPQADPFAPPTPAAGPAPLPGRRRTRSSGRHRERERTPPPPVPLQQPQRTGPPRPQTAPPKNDIYGVQQPLYPAVVQPYFYPHLPAPPPPPPHRRSRSTSQAAPPTHTRSYSYQQPPVAHRQGSYPPPPPPPGFMYAQPGPGPQPMYAPQPPPYAPGPVYAQPQPMYQPQPVRSPTREVPLLRRVFGFGGGGGGGGSGKLSRESSRGRDSGRYAALLSPVARPRWGPPRRESQRHTPHSPRTRSRPVRGASAPYPTYPATLRPSAPSLRLRATRPLPTTSTSPPTSYIPHTPL
ncbi:hypothetical protein DFH09DRAFT_1369570 [Mycena vulgaris]|nr:hypothetical protein DFH09DRAFT_1369570 [Mycena vulgaris]